MTVICLKHLLLVCWLVLCWDLHCKMYVDGWVLFAIYFIAVLALAVSVYALWSLEEIRRYYEKKNTVEQQYKTPGRKGR